MALTELIDDQTAYADVADVEDFFRSKSFDASTSPTESRVKQKLLHASDQVDKLTRRAWRERRVNNRELEVDASSSQKRRLSARSKGSRVLPGADVRGRASLPHESIKQIDPAKGDKIEILLPRETKEITDEEGRSADMAWVMDYRKGVLEVDLLEFRRGPLRQRGTGMLDRRRVRITYRYGRDQPVPGDIRRATAMLVASDLIDSDSYSDLVPGGDSAPDQANSADKYEERAHDILADYSYKKVM